jgi:transmembrane sensor
MDKELLNRFFKGECSEEEIRLILKWYHDQDSEYLLNNEIETLWAKDSADRSIEFTDKETVYKAITKHIGFNDSRIVELNSHQSKKKNRIMLFLKIAASISLFLLVGLLAYKFQFTTNNEPVPQVTEYTTKSTPRGQKATVFLPDGSKVRLNSKSELKYETYFSDTNRVVHLTGEAFFEVVADPQRPFTVITSDLATIAIGTSFNIHSYPEEKEIKVSLTSGKVKIRQKSELQNSDNFELTLEPGYQAVFNPVKNTIRKTAFDIKTLSWKDNNLYFKDAEFEEIIKELEMWYGVNIQVENEIFEDKLYTGEFRDTSLKNVLESLSFTKNFSFTITGDQVYIKFIKT